MFEEISGSNLFLKYDVNGDDFACVPACSSEIQFIFDEIQFSPWMIIDRK
jgi:hypothetical protein